MVMFDETFFPGISLKVKIEIVNIKETPKDLHRETNKIKIRSSKRLNTIVKSIWVLTVHCRHMEERLSNPVSIYFTETDSSTYKAVVLSVNMVVVTG